MPQGGHRIFSSHILSDSVSDSSNPESWRLLFYYNLYRFSIGIFLVTSSISPIIVGNLGKTSPTLFSILAVIYAALAIIFGVLIHHSWPGYVAVSRITIITDITLIVGMIFTSGSLGSGLELLLVISVAASGLLLGGRSAMAAAALATILLLSQHSYLIIADVRKPGGFTAMGFMGLGLFITAFLIYHLSLRLRTSEAKLIDQQQDITHLNKLNQYVIDKLTMGILIVDNIEQVRLINQQARVLLNLHGDLKLPKAINLVSRHIEAAAEQWRSSPQDNEIRVSPDANTVWLVNFQSFSDTAERAGFFIIFDDLSQVEKDRQNDKLISMGKLTASIAHEIRNPLGAISHAGQLLKESDSLSEDNTRLISIITKQSDRVNRIIQTILELGRPAKAELGQVQLNDWLQSIIKTYKHDNNIQTDVIVLQGENDASGCIDPEQMQLAVVNLIQNALYHAKPDSSPKVIIKLSKNRYNKAPQIEIHDTGSGVPENLSERIFEPFFTTSSTGNGLGLFVARQICVGSYGELEYIYDESKEGYFRISLQPETWCNEINQTESSNMITAKQ